MMLGNRQALELAQRLQTYRNDRDPGHTRDQPEPSPLPNGGSHLFKADLCCRYCGLPWDREAVSLGVCAGRSKALTPRRMGGELPSNWKPPKRSSGGKGRKRCGKRKPGHREERCTGLRGHDGPHRLGGAEWG